MSCIIFFLFLLSLSIHFTRFNRAKMSKRSNSPIGLSSNPPLLCIEVLRLEIEPVDLSSSSFSNRYPPSHCFKCLVNQLAAKYNVGTVALLVVKKFSTEILNLPLGSDGCARTKRRRGGRLFRTTVSCVVHSGFHSLTIPSLVIVGP